MKINSFLIADKSQSVDIPIPIAPVPATFEEANIIYPYMMYNENVHKSAMLSNTRRSREEFDQNSGEYLRTQGYDTIPCNWDAGGETTLYPNSELSDYYTDMEIYSPKGSIPLTIGNTLTPGKYCFQMLFWIGYYDALDETSQTAFIGHVWLDGNKKEIVKQGSQGAIHAKVIDANGVIYQGAKTNPYQSPYYRGNCVCIQVRYGFEIAQGDTTKTFSFGEGTEFSFLELYRAIKMWETSSSYDPYGRRGSVWANCMFVMHLKLFTSI